MGNNGGDKNGGNNDTAVDKSKTNSQTHKTPSNSHIHISNNNNNDQNDKKKNDKKPSSSKSKSTTKPKKSKKHQKEQQPNFAATHLWSLLDQDDLDAVMFPALSLSDDDHLSFSDDDPTDLANLDDFVDLDDSTGQKVLNFGEEFGSYDLDFNGIVHQQQQGKSPGSNQMATAPLLGSGGSGSGHHRHHQHHHQQLQQQQSYQRQPTSQQHQQQNKALLRQQQQQQQQNNENNDPIINTTSLEQALG